MYDRVAAPDSGRRAERGATAGAADALRVKQKDAVIVSLATAGQALLDALENCHICGALLHVQREPAHCSDCSANCEDHHQPDCPRFGDLIDALRKVIADTQTRKGGS
jgi:hypothetical protein